MIQELDADTYRQRVVAAGPPAFIECWTPWCVYSRLVEAKMKQLAERLGEQWLVARVQADRHPGLVRALGVAYVPAVVLVREGCVLQRWYGDRRLNAYLRSIEKYEAREQAIEETL